MTTTGHGTVSAGTGIDRTVITTEVLEGPRREWPVQW